MSSSSNYFKLFGSQFRCISTHMRISQKKSHYDALGISSKATQADVKSAYYKLSMVYHPDKNKDSEEAAKKFRDITEAYEVLGNVKTRKLYDRGLLFQSSEAVQEDIPINKFYKARDVRSRPPVNYGRTTVYDFDEWSRSHYGATFQNDMKFKERQRFKMKRQQQIADDVKSEKVVLLVGILLLCAAYLFYDKDYDAPEKVTVMGGHIYVSPKEE